MDILEQFIEDYNEGIITLSDLQRRLEFDDWSKSKSQPPIPIDYIRLPLNPLDIVLEEERLNRIKDMLMRLKEELTDKEWNIVVLLSLGKTQQYIANTMHIAQPNICQKIRKIRDKVSSLNINLKELLEKPSPVYEAETPKVMIRYPMDFMMHKEVDGKVKCCVPEYIKYNCKFDKTVCCYCDREKCTRKSQNPINE